MSVVFNKIKDAPLVGEYLNTSIDHKKLNSDFRLISIDGNYYGIGFNDGRDNIIIKGKREFNKFSRNKNFVTDF